MYGVGFHFQQFAIFQSYKRPRMNMRTRYKEPTSFNKFEKVIYIPNHADNRDHPDCEIGFVSSVNEKYIFVKFANQLAKFGWNGTTAEAVAPFNLIRMKGKWPEETY